MPDATLEDAPTVEPTGVLTMAAENGRPTRGWRHAAAAPTAVPMWTSADAAIAKVTVVPEVILEEATMTLATGALVMTMEKGRQTGRWRRIVVLVVVPVGELASKVVKAALEGAPM
jgi:hypothetical protein